MMNAAYVRQIALREMPRVQAQLVDGSKRWDVIAPLRGTDNIGIELGVAAGEFSSQMMRSGKFKLFFGVDCYEEGPHLAEYKVALRRIGIEEPYKLLRMRFEEALDLFPEHFFDFIYVDGYAHTGEDGGAPLIQWFDKLKPGGVMAGDDYHENWPLVMWAVNDLAHQLGVQLHLTDQVQDGPYSSYPSWYFVKGQSTSADLAQSPKLAKLAQRERERLAKIRSSRGVAHLVRRAVLPMLHRLHLTEPVKRMLGR